jgi:hypothetical protein
VSGGGSPGSKFEISSESFVTLNWSWETGNPPE